MYIAVDFDGTCVTHEYPKVGQDIGAVPILKELIKLGHKIILNTMRDSVELQDAVTWFKVNGIELFGINSNPTQKRWTTSPKVYGHIYIDDAALGCPLMHRSDMGERAFVDWRGVANYLFAYGIFTKETAEKFQNIWD